MSPYTIANKKYFLYGQSWQVILIEIEMTILKQCFLQSGYRPRRSYITVTLVLPFCLLLLKWYTYLCHGSPCSAVCMTVQCDVFWHFLKCVVCGSRFAGSCKVCKQFIWNIGVVGVTVASLVVRYIDHFAFATLICELFSIDWRSFS